MKSFEIEYKATVTEKVLEEIVAFANTSGGTVYFGVADDSTVVGLQDVMTSAQN